MKKQNGITLIGLVITIIVILILAVVSINTIIGDNGVINNSQKVNYIQSCRILEEFFNEKYVENFEETLNSKDVLSKMLELYPNYFYIPANENVGGLRYIVDEEGHALYLIKKSALPEEISKQIKGGDAGEGTFFDYQNLNDVYGVTSNLKVYYSSGGIDGIEGVDFDQIDKDNPLRTVFDNSLNKGVYALLSKYDLNGDEELSSEELRSVKSLTITSEDDIINLKEFYNLTSLKELIFDNVNINLEGIQNISKLNYICFKNYTTEENLCAGYEYISDVVNLKYLYLYNSSNKQVADLFNSISSAQFKNLEYLGIFGYLNTSLEQGTTTKNYYDNNKGRIGKVSDISALSNLSNITKQAVKYIYLQNNQLTNIIALKDFINITYLRIEENYIESLAGIENMNNLEYLFAAYNNLGINENEISLNKEIDSLSALDNKENVKFVNLENNENLIWVQYLKNCSNIEELYLKGCVKINDENIKLIADIINNCGKKISYSSKNLMAIVTDDMVLADLSNLTLSLEQFESLMNKTKIKCMDMTNLILLDESNNIISDEEKINEEINKVLSTLPSMEHLRIYSEKNSDSIVNLSSIKFVENMNDLLEIDLRGTKVITNAGDISKNGLELLNENCPKIGCLWVNNSQIDFVYLQECLSKMWTNYDISKGFNVLEFAYFKVNTWFLQCHDATAMSTLSNCENISGCVAFASSPYYSNVTLDFHLNDNITGLYYGWGRPVKSIIMSPNMSYIDCGGTSTLITLDFQYVTTTVDYINFGALKYDTLKSALNSIPSDLVVNRMTVRLTNSSYYGKNTLECFSECKFVLKQLELGHFWLNDSNNFIEKLDGIESFSDSIEVLKLQNCYALNDISKIENLSKLKEIYFTNSSVNSLDSIKNLEQLEYLDISNCSLYDQSVNSSTGEVTNNIGVLIELNNNYSLKKLYISDNYISIAGLNQLLQYNWEDKEGF